ncbi:unnamed protein product, partial [marine sediment metagenome]
LIVGISSFYVQIQIETGNACGCLIPIPIFIPFLASVGLFIGALVYYFFTPRLEGKKIDKNVILRVFDSDEKSMINFLLESKGEATQSRMVNGTGLSKVKVFRVLERLSKKGIVQKEPYGKTNAITLNESLLDLFK